MADSDEALQLKRRARRRLVGAVTLVTLVVIILPLILDKEPGPAGPPLEVQIPKQESSGFAPRTPPAPQNPAAEKKAEIAPANAASPAIKAETPPVESALAPAENAAKAKALPAERGQQARPQAAPGEQSWAVTLDAFSNAKNVQQLQSKLSAAGVTSYAELVTTGKGDLTRVRAGPFASKEAAEKARAKLESMGFKPGPVASR